MTLNQLDKATFAHEWRAWHDERDRRRSSAHGFLSITALHWLSDVPTRFDGAPGEWSAGVTGVRVVLGPNETLIVEGTTVRGAYDFGVLKDDDSRKAVYGDAVIEVAKRGTGYIIRPRHPDHDLVRNFKGTPTFPLDLRWRVQGHFHAFDSPRKVEVGSVAEYEREYETRGEVAFSLEGTTHRLCLFGEPDAQGFLLLFSDLTSGASTYGTRELEVGPSDDEGRVTLDFNRAANLPCAYTDFSTCPVAPAENRLPVAVDAGEKIPYERLRS